MLLGQGSLGVAALRQGRLRCDVVDGLRPAAGGDTWARRGSAVRLRTRRGRRLRGSAIGRSGCRLDEDPSPGSRRDVRRQPLLSRRRGGNGGPVVLKGDRRALRTGAGGARARARQGDGEERHSRHQQRYERSRADGAMRENHGLWSTNGSTSRSVRPPPRHGRGRSNARHASTPCAVEGQASSSSEGSPARGKNATSEASSGAARSVPPTSRPW